MRMRRTLPAALVVTALLAACADDAPVAPTKSPPVFTKSAPTGDPGLAMLQEINRKLAARGLNIRAEAIEYFAIGNGRPSNRIHQQEFRWVPDDERRLADGDNITHIIDVSGGNTTSGLTAAQTGAEIRTAIGTWAASKELQKVEIVERPDPGTDITIFDSFFGFGGFGDPFAADIVNAGWFPRAFFEAAGGPGGGRGILAFSVTFIFTDDADNPTDINGDNRLDTALNEVYYNDTFGDPADDRAGNPWSIGLPLPAIDVQTVAFHENGHSLGVGHFGPPPDAVMNPVYAGIRLTAFPTDQAGMRTVWSSWPNP